MFEEQIDALADYEAEMEANVETMTAAEYDDWLLDQQAAADVAAERHAERALSFGYGS